MTDEEIEKFRKAVSDLTTTCSDGNSEHGIEPGLKKIARQVGASTRALSTGDADTSEIIRNIHQALQTASMANMCGKATQGYEIATKASKSASIQFWVAVTIAFVSAVAAWVAAMKT